MTVAEKLALDETDPLEWDEICARFPDQYVCLVDLVKLEPGNPDFKTARVVGHGATRAEAFEPIRGDLHNKYPRHAVRFTGEPGPLIRPALVIDDETLASVHS